MDNAYCSCGRAVNLLRDSMFNVRPTEQGSGAVTKL